MNGFVQIAHGTHVLRCVKRSLLYNVSALVKQVGPVGNGQVSKTG